VDVAYDFGCSAIDLKMIPEFSTPVLIRKRTPGDVAPTLSQAGTSNDDEVARLEQFKRLLNESRYVFDEQRSLIRRLHARLKRSLGSKVPDDVGFDETFFRLYDETALSQKT